MKKIICIIIIFFLPLSVYADDNSLLKFDDKLFIEKIIRSFFKEIQKIQRPPVLNKTRFFLLCLEKNDHFNRKISECKKVTDEFYKKTVTEE